MKKLIIIIIAIIIACVDCLAQSTIYTTSALNIRQNPTTNSRVLAVIPNGTSFICDNDEILYNNWVAVNYNGISGYVNSAYLSKTKSLVAKSNPTSNYNWTQSTSRSNNYSRYNSSKSSTNSSRGYYNSNGHWVQSPSYSGGGATAVCNDGTYSYSQSRRGTCSWHGGVKYFLR